MIGLVKQNFLGTVFQKNYSLIVSGSFINPIEGLSQIGFGERAPILTHEIGHTFGLYHTHQARNDFTTDFSDNGGASDCYQESVSRTKKQGFGCSANTYNKKKCVVNGDLLCDTPADPSLLGATISTVCDYTDNHIDNWGAIWVPDETNFMSYSRPGCLNNFSPLQIGKMILYYNLLFPNHPSISISGNDYLCSGSVATYQAATSQSVSDYMWTTSSNYSILSGQGTDTITVQANNNNTGIIRLNTDCGHFEVTKSIQGIYSIGVDGVTDVCPDTNHTYSTDYLSGATYNWSVSSGTIISGQGTNSAVIKIAGHPSFQSLVTANITNYCNYNTSASYIVDIYNPSPNDPPCVNNSGNDDKGMSNNDLDANTFLSPNPANNKTYISIETNNSYYLEVYDISGNVIKKKSKIYQGKEIDTSRWGEGIYIFRFTVGENVFLKKLIIKK